MILLNCNCDWQNVINAIPCICWGIIVLTAVLFYLKYDMPSCIKNKHELKMKKEVLEHEKWWEEIKWRKANSDENLIKKIDELSKENEDLKRKLDIEKSRQEVLNKHLEEYKQHMNIIMSNSKNR